MTFARAGLSSLVLKQPVMNEGGIPSALLQLGFLPPTAGFPESVSEVGSSLWELPTVL